TNANDFNLQVGIDGGINSSLIFTSADTAYFSGTVAAKTDVTNAGNPSPFSGQPDGIADFDDFTYYLNFISSNPTFDQLAAYTGNNIFTTAVTDSNGENRDLLGVITFGNYGGGASNI